MSEKKDIKISEEKVQQEAGQMEQEPKDSQKEGTRSEKTDKKDGKKEKSDEKTVRNLKEKTAELEKEVESLKKKISDEKNDYLRLMAEFETYRRRTAEDRLQLVSSASSETIKGLLPVLDDCERAIEMLQSSSDQAAKDGTNLIYSKLMGYLKSKGLEPIKAKGEKFDTDFHEAVAKVPVDDESKKNLVYDVVETGYLLNGKVLRYAKVVVGI